MNNMYIVIPEEAVEAVKLIAKLVGDGKIYIADNTESEPKVKSGWTVEGRKGSGGRIKFNKYGVNVGDTLVFLPTGAKVKVYDNNNVTGDNGEPVAPSTYAREHMPEELRTKHKDDTWDGLKYFAVNGGDVPLAEIRQLVSILSEPAG